MIALVRLAWVVSAVIAVGAVAAAIYYIAKPIRQGARVLAAAARIIESELQENHGSSLVDRVAFTYDKIRALEPAVAEHVAGIADLRGEIAGMKTSLDANYDRLDAYREQVMGFAEDRRALASRLDTQNDRLARIDTRVGELELARRTLDAHVEVVQAITSPPTSPAVAGE